MTGCWVVAKEMRGRGREREREKDRERERLRERRERQRDREGQGVQDINNFFISLTDFLLNASTS